MRVCAVDPAADQSKPVPSIALRYSVLDNSICVGAPKKYAPDKLPPILKSAGDAPATSRAVTGYANAEYLAPNPSPVPTPYGSRDA